MASKTSSSGGVPIKPTVQLVHGVARTVFDRRTTYVALQQLGFFIVEESLDANSDMPPLVTRWAQIRSADLKYEVRTEFDQDRGKGVTRLLSPDASDFDEWLQDIHQHPESYRPKPNVDSFFANTWTVSESSECKEVSVGPVYDQDVKSHKIHQPILWQLFFLTLHPVS